MNRINNSATLDIKFWGLLFSSLAGSLLVGLSVSGGSFRYILFGLAATAYLLIVLFNERLALALYIPVNLSGDLGLLALENIAIAGLNLQTLTTASLVLGFVLRMVIERRPWKKTELERPVFVFLFVIYTIWSFWRFGQFSLPDSDHLAILKRFLSMVLIYFIAANSHSNRKWLKTYLWTALLTGLVFAIRDVVIYVQAGGGQFILDWHKLRLSETTGLDLIGGNVTLQGLLFALAFGQLVSLKASNKFFLGVISLLSMTVVFLSFYRAAMLAIAVMIVISVLFQKGSQRWAVLGVLLLILVFFSPSAFIERIASTFGGNESIAGLNLDLTGRANYYWPLAWEKSIEYFPFGIGLGNAYPPTFNILLRWLLEFGIVGLVCGLWFVIALVVYLWRRFHKEKELFLRSFGISLFAAWIGILIRGMGGDIIQQIWFSIFLLLLGAYAGNVGGDTIVTYPNSSKEKIYIG